MRTGITQSICGTFARKESLTIPEPRWCRGGGAAFVALFVGSFGLAMLAGCAQTGIVPDRGREGLWNTLFPQRGPRFYLPRPYIVVLKEFPVATSIKLVPGYIAGDGLLVRFDETVKDVLSADGIYSGKPVDRGDSFGWLLLKSAKSLIVPTAGKGGDGAASGSEPTSAIDAAVASGVKDGLEAAANPTQPVTSEDAVHGGTASAWAKKGDITEFRDAVNSLFEIRYLPDLEERYVIESEAGLGQASLDAYLSRGWIVQHYGQNVDRRELGEFVFRNIQDVLDIAKTIGKAALMDVFPTTIASAGAVESTEGIVNTAAGETVEGPRKVMVKIVVVEYAVPGVYPILKPHELPTVDSNGLVQIIIPGSKQQPASAALPVAYRTRKDIFVSAVQAVTGMEKPTRTNDPNGSTLPHKAEIDRALNAHAQSLVNEEGALLSLAAALAKDPKGNYYVRAKATFTQETSQGDKDSLKAKIKASIKKFLTGTYRGFDYDPVVQFVD